jgi:hypothetical protein
MAGSGCRLDTLLVGANMIKLLGEIDPTPPLSLSRHQHLFST